MTLPSDHYCERRGCKLCRELDAYLKADHVRRGWPGPELRSDIPSIMPAVEAAMRKWGVPQAALPMDFPEAARRRRRTRRAA